MNNQFTLLLVLCLVGAVSAAERPKVAVVPMGTTHNFWKSIEAGARQAGGELGVEIIFKGPMKEDDRAQQIAVVQQFVAAKVAAIVLAPLDSVALRTPVLAARERGIPVVIIDSPLKGEAPKDFVSLVATDNHLGGKLGAEELVRQLGGKGKVVLLRCNEGSASTGAREAGFLAEMKRHPGINVIVDNRYGGSLVATAQDTAMNLLDKIREADGIFCSNETTTHGMLLALRQTGLAGKKKFVGFDAAPVLLQALEKGDIHGLVAQNPNRIGYVGVTTAVRALRGDKVEPRIDTGCQVVTRANLNEPAVKTILGR
jgi:ribose transport system substrate-binding protein